MLQFTVSFDQTAALAEPLDWVFEDASGVLTPDDISTGGSVTIQVSFLSDLVFPAYVVVPPDSPSVVTAAGGQVLPGRYRVPES